MSYNDERIVYLIENVETLCRLNKDQKRSLSAISESNEVKDFLDDTG